MGIFSKKPKRLEITDKFLKNHGIQLTDEEELEVLDTFGHYYDSAVDDQYYDIFVKGLIASALSSYANTNSVFSTLEDKTKKERTLINAESAIRKAHPIHELPIYLYELAQILLIAEKNEEALTTFINFLSEQKDFTPGRVDRAMQASKNVEIAISNAKNEIDKLKGN